MTYINVSKTIPLKRKEFGLIKSVTSMCDSENLQGESVTVKSYSHDPIATAIFIATNGLCRIQC